MTYDDLCLLDEPDALKVVQAMMAADAQAFRAEPSFTEFCLREAFKIATSRRKAQSREQSRGGYKGHREATNQSARQNAAIRKRTVGIITEV
jgi:hypothetical protein